MSQSEKKANVRVLPLPKVKALWQHDWSDYPDMIRVPMSDGTVINYVRDVAQPRPMLGKALDRFSAACGYKNGGENHGGNREEG